MYRGSNPRPFECKSNVIPLHHTPELNIILYLKYIYQIKFNYLTYNKIYLNNFYIFNFINIFFKYFKKY